MRAAGEVYIVGAGPGDPELLTLKAARLIREADTIVHDRLVAPEILQLARPQAERIYVGKARSAHVVPQAEINALLIGLAAAGKRVVRLKGGDPFVFGRGAEEAEALAQAGIPFEVVPGVTAGCGAAAYAGIPLTHRDFAHACIFATGCLSAGNTDLDWAMLARPRQTVVIYMGLAALELICSRLVSHGLAPDTPAALVEKATTPSQRVITGTLASLPERVRSAAAKPPTLVIIGEVVKLRARLDWFRSLPGVVLGQVLAEAAADARGAPAVTGREAMALPEPAACDRRV
ncbi:MAG: uroporphyrinogen-III C-methyltransferase [Betaproteobacteria bacterium RIFCSPLOWO2_12_FULL_62_13]|nr:MAG: uroporphyrinogen-III C-methyltransferase [Betaproteobacteria bacterium RIFCSPLOWO2_12_FULL_62_13]